MYFVISQLLKKNKEEEICFLKTNIFRYIQTYWQRLVIFGLSEKTNINDELL